MRLVSEEAGEHENYARTLLYILNQTLFPVLSAQLLQGLRRQSLDHFEKQMERVHILSPLSQKERKEGRYSIKHKFMTSRSTHLQTSLQPGLLPVPEGASHPFADSPALPCDPSGAEKGKENAHVES